MTWAGLVLDSTEGATELQWWHIAVAILSSASVAAAITAVVQRPKIKGDAAKSATEAAAEVVEFLREELATLRAEVVTLRTSEAALRAEVAKLKEHIARAPQARTRREDKAP